MQKGNCNHFLILFFTKKVDIKLVKKQRIQIVSIVHFITDIVLFDNVLVVDKYHILQLDSSLP